MFTGLIESVGEVTAVTPAAGGYRLCVATALAEYLKPGDSLAVNGVCLTVTVSALGSVHADVGPETAQVTTLAGLKQGTPVNLERPLRADSRLGGHFVQGHVDAIGTVRDVRPDAECHWLTIAFSPLLASYFVQKGSVAVDGISLTIAGLATDWFDVQIIPFTWHHTTLQTLSRGDRVNLECDVLGKYVARVAELMGLWARQASTLP